MNCNVLKNKDYELGITEIYNNVISEYGQHVSKSLLWDYLKIKIKEYSIAYGIEQARSYKDNCKKLESELNDLDKVLTKHKDIATNQKRKEIKQQLDEYYAKKARGYQIRSRARWVEEGEQSTKYFLGLEKSRQSFNCISSLKDSNGHTALTDNEILDVAHSFYTDLYKSKSEYREEIRSAFDTLIPENVLNAELQEKCEGLVTKYECFEAIKTIEFYEHFWPLIGDLLTTVFNESFENEILPLSQRRALLSLIFKNGDAEDIANYQPISLTNVDYRILAFVLAGRLQKVISSIVSHDQTAYIKKRYMGYNIRLVDDIIAHYDQAQKKGLIFMADFSKAFDSLEWDFMLKTLDFFHFGPSLKQWVKTI